MIPHPMSAVALVNANDSVVAIWHVAAEPIAQTARLCGAWVTDDTEIQRKVVAARAVVVFGGEPNELVKPLMSHAGGIIDLKATLIAIEQHISTVDEIHSVSRTPLGNPRAPIIWPTAPTMLDWNDLPPVPAGVVNDPLIRPTIAAARWLAALADTWSAVETARTSRSHLAEESPVAAPLPFVLGL